MSARSKARELALQVLFQDEFQLGIDYKQALDLYQEAFENDQNAFEYASRLVHGVKSYRDQIDEVIKNTNTKWKIDRMAVVDRNILRIGIFELKFFNEDIPKSVVINEAVEIAKKYGSNESKAFINGILDNISKNI